MDVMNACVFCLEISMRDCNSGSLCSVSFSTKHNLRSLPFTVKDFIEELFQFQLIVYSIFQLLSVLCTAHSIYLCTDVCQLLVPKNNTKHLKCQPVEGFYWCSHKQRANNVKCVAVELNREGST